MFGGSPHEEKVTALGRLGTTDIEHTGCNLHINRKDPNTWRMKQTQVISLNSLQINK